MTLGELNALDSESASRALLKCCGSTRWARAMSAARPFDSPDALAVTSDIIWASVGRDGWLEAFAAHPRIGAGEAGRAGTDWSAQEQSGVDDSTHARFASLNREYEARFGYIFIVCATSKSGDEMLRILERRMLNNPDDELQEAADEQRQITRLRLAKLLAPQDL